jgi:hypothetical protein
VAAAMHMPEHATWLWRGHRRRFALQRSLHPAGG